MMKLKKFYVPFTLSYDGYTHYWDVKAKTKEEAREIAKYELSTDRDVTHIGSVKYIMDLGEVKKDGY